MSSVNYAQLENKTMYSPLDEDSVIEMEDLREKTITDLFGEQIEKMNQKIKERNLNIGFFTGLGMLSGTFWGTVFMVLNSLNTSNVFLAFGVTSYGGLGFGSAFLFFLLRRPDLKIHLDDFTIYPSLLTEFHNAILKFNEDPKECKITSLFQKFEALAFSCSHTINFLRLKGLLGEEADLFFTSSGKVYLMDVVVELLRKQNEESHIVKDWDLLISSSLADGFSDMNKEFWAQIEVKEPSLEDYTYFFARPSQFKSIDISFKVNELYRQAIHNGMEQNLI